MAVPRPQNEQFNDDYNQAGGQLGSNLNNGNPWNIQNPRKSTSEPDNRRGRQSSSRRNSDTRYLNAPPPQNNFTAPAPYESSPRNERLSQKNSSTAVDDDEDGTPSIKKISAEARATGIIQGTIILSWSLYDWAIIQLPLSILSITMFGIAASTKDSWMDGAIKVVATFFGYTWVDSAAIAMITLTLPMALVWFNLLAAVMEFKFSGLHPLMGNGAGVKKPLFILSLVCAAIPGLNLFPIMTLWVLAVMIYPK